MTNCLSLYAGKEAISRISKNGLSPEDISVIPGAAGGPKFLVFTGLDRAIFGSWLKTEGHPVHLVGSSIGAWRFAALAQQDDLKAFERFEDAYIKQSYSQYEDMPSPAEVSLESRTIMETFLDREGIRSILSHPFLRMNILATRCRWPLSTERRLPLVISLITTGLMNAASRKTLGIRMTRTIFSDPRESLPIRDPDSIPTDRVALSTDNFTEAAMASGSIPVVMEGIDRIEGAPQGIYRDGGLIDYHIDMPFGGEGLVLFPHYAPRISPSWFDKHFNHKRPVNMDKVVLVCPSRSFIAGLPFGRIPDREDFKTFHQEDDKRMSFWRRVSAESERLGDEFLDAACSDDLPAKIRPIEEIFG